MALQAYARRMGMDSGSGVQQVLTTADGRFDVLLRAEDSGIFIGGLNSATEAAGGYQLTAGVEYRFDVFCQDGTYLRQLYTATSSASTVYLDVLVNPKF